MEPFHWLPALPLNFTPSIWPVMNGGGGDVLGGVWGMCRGIIIIHPPPLPPPPHPPNHHWCDKNFTSLRNFIYSVDIRLWLKTIKRREGVRESWCGHALNSICKSNPGHLSFGSQGDWLTDCLLSTWHTGTAFTMTSGFKAATFSLQFPASIFLTYCPLQAFFTLQKRGERILRTKPEVETMLKCG